MSKQNNRRNNVDKQHSFAQIPKADIPRSTFDRSCGLKTTFDSGYLVPIFADECLPGDTINLQMSSFARMNTPVAPILDNLTMDTFWFAVPIRLLWDNWKKFNGEQTNPGDSIDFQVPVADTPASVGAASESLSDYLGIPTGIPDLEHSALWHRAYNLIYNEWFRAQDLVDSVVVDTDDGPDDPADYVLLRRGKRHDYFTSCLPWPQKGDPIEVSLGGIATISATGNEQPTWTTTTDPTVRNLAGVSGLATVMATGGTFGSGANLVWEDPKLEADLSTATPISINALRLAFQSQRLLERDARGGTRYTEQIRSHFGVTSPDARMQRPEYLGGGSAQITVNPVATTLATTVPLQKVGDLAAYVTTAHTNRGFVYSATEHCVILGLTNVRADLNYQQGLPRMFSRKNRFDFFYPVLSHIGEQAVLNKEIYAQGSADAVADEAVFGYQEAWAEYRYKPSMITGKMRSQDPQSLDVWHLAQDFSTLPLLNDSFIADDPPVDRIVATQDEPHWKMDAFFKFTHTRPMPTFSVPGMIDHF